MMGSVSERVREEDTVLSARGSVRLEITALRRCDKDLGGKAVNIARAMLAVEGIFIWDDPECDTLPIVVKKMEAGELQEGTLVKAECWPNPSDGLIFVRFDVPALTGMVTVTDAQGRQLLHKHFETNGEPLALDGSGWSQGLVVIRVESGNGDLFIWHVLLQR